MWLSYRRQELLAYDKPWQRVEAFRYLLQTACESLNGYPDFKGMVPNASPAKKGDTGLKPKGQGGGIKLDALLQVDLPPKSKLKFESRLAREQSL